MIEKRITESDARAAMDEIIDTAQRWMTTYEQAMVLAQAFEAQEHFKALGYRSMAACWAAEMGQTRQRWYQLREQFQASAMLEEATGEHVEVSHRRARSLRQPEAKVSNRLSLSASAREGAAPSPATPLPITRVGRDELTGRPDPRVPRLRTRGGCMDCGHGHGGTAERADRAGCTSCPCARYRGG